VTARAKQADEPAALSKSAIRRNAPPEIVRQGEEYVRRGAVVLHGNVLTTEVEGSESEPYQVSVTLRGLGGHLVVDPIEELTLQRRVQPTQLDTGTSAIVNCQSSVPCKALRHASHAGTSRANCARFMRRARHRRSKTDNSISATFNQEPCSGV
jgi:hypothetical protein